MAEPRKPDIKKSILNRVRMLYILFFAVGVAIAGKILYIQYGPGGESLRSKGERISYERVAIEADRGDVLAWDGRLLATSVPMYEVRMDFAAQGLADSVFRGIARAGTRIRNPGFRTGQCFRRRGNPAAETAVVGRTQCGASAVG